MDMLKEVITGSIFLLFFHLSGDFIMWPHEPFTSIKTQGSHSEQR